nr:MAG TPA: hypothetical protein [Bacteriophage sp.]
MFSIIQEFKKGLLYKYTPYLYPFNTHHIPTFICYYVIVDRVKRSLMILLDVN